MIVVLEGSKESKQQADQLSAAVSRPALNSQYYPGICERKSFHRNPHLLTHPYLEHSLYFSKGLVHQAPIYLKITHLVRAFSPHVDVPAPPFTPSVGTSTRGYPFSPMLTSSYQSQLPLMPQAEIFLAV